jgi:AmmeMemoRadiSam system protein B/AmmeMemoRadiSam system protein A
MFDVRKIMRSLLLIVLVSLSLAVACQAGKPLEDDVRSPTFAGRFYPDSAPVLKLAIQKFMEGAVPARVKDPVAIIVPHAGYIFSGQICADGYRQVSGRSYDTVVILGTNHTNPGFGKISVFSGDGYRTPLGIAGVDRKMASALAAADPDCVLEDLLHVREHSVEVQVPFVQVLFPGARIVPVIVGTQDVDACVRFGRALAKVVGRTRTLIVASTDLSHYPDAKDAAAVDRETLAAVVTLDAAVLHEKTKALMDRHVPNLDTCACGEAPMMAAMTAAKALGATGGTVVSYLNSGDVPVGERTRVVGYAAVALAAGEERPSSKKEGSAKTPADVTLSPAEKKTLLAFARESIARYLATRTIPLARGFDPRLQIHRGVFVTLMKKGELRGCIGHVPADTPLVSLVGAMALKSAFADPRFYPLGDEELGQVEIEISMLTLPRTVSGPAEFRVGRDGVILQKEGRAALFLPQVAPKEGWGRDETLDHLCLKAGLERGCWKEGARLSTFEAVVFSESEFR